MRCIVYWCSSDYKAKWKHTEQNVDHSQPQTRLSTYEHLKGGESYSGGNFNNMERGC